MKGKSAVVTGLSPKEGIPGTQIVIRGENLGSNQKDLIGVVICGTDCLMSARWESSHKIIARVGQAKGGQGEVFVYTKSGGKGSCSVMFRVYTVQIGPMQESAVWVDESRTVPGRQTSGPATTAIVDEDPLGISEERDERRVTEASLPDLYPDGSGNIRLENFVPVWYLLENHQGATVQDLRTGLDYMNKHHAAFMGGPRDLIKSNLHAFLSCIDALAALHDKIKEQAKKEWPPTKSLDEKVRNCGNTADNLFADVLGRKERADATRNALSILQRFKFLFFLSHNISKNMDSGDYNAIFYDYTRAKSLFGETEVPLFKEAYEEVEKQMEVFKETLKNKLLEMPSTLEEQKITIKFLLNLDPDSDPGWDCLSAHHLWLQGILWDTQNKLYEAAKKEEEEQEADSDFDDRIVTELPKWFMFVETVTKELSTKLQHFWKLGQAYVNGQLSAKPNLHREAEIEHMVLSTINLASWIMLNALLPEFLPQNIKKEEYSDRFVDWPRTGKRSQLTNLLMHSLRNIRAFIRTLCQQELTQLHPLTELCVTLRLACLDRIVDGAIKEVNGLAAKENWKLQTKEEEYAKTHLPDMFEGLLFENLPQIREILSHTNFPDETDLFSERMRTGAILRTFHFLVVSLKSVIESMVRLNPATSMSSPGPNSTPERPVNLNLTDTPGKDRVTVKDKKLLIALSNSDYVLRFSLETVVRRLKESGVKKTDTILDQCRHDYATLRSVLLKAYIAAKCNPFSELINPVDYKVVTEISGVSNFIKDLVLCIVSVQAELFLVAPHFSQQVMSYVVKSCADILSTHIKSLDPHHLGPVGTSQAVLDSLAFEESVQSYLALDTTKMVQSSRSKLEKQADRDDVNAFLVRYRDRTRLTLLSLQGAAETADV